MEKILVSLGKASEKTLGGQPFNQLDNPENPAEDRRGNNPAID